jgi:pyridoxine 5-phosphate synthase
MTRSIELGINIDHVATVRQARRASYPDPVHAALLAEQAGADNITLHLREDRRHIQDRDVHSLRTAAADAHESRDGSDRRNGRHRDRRASARLLSRARESRRDHDRRRPRCGRRHRSCRGWSAQARGRQAFRVALFIAPDLSQIDAAKRSGAPVIELHTGTYAEATGSAQARELERLSTAAKRAANLGLEVHAGHGLTYNNVAPVAAIAEVVELNIGHCIIARAIFVGLEAAVRDMKTLMNGARR